MATHANSTRTPLLTPPGVAPPLLPAGPGEVSGPSIVAPVGPVSRALKAGRGERTAAPDPTTFPEWYAMWVEGDCCAPEIPTDCHVMCNSLKAPERGDFVVIHFTPEAAARVGYDAWVKHLVFLQRPPRPGSKPRYVSNVEPCVCVEQLNPRRSYTIPWTAIREVHLCEGKIPTDVRLIPNPAAVKRRAARKAARAEVAA